MNSLGRSSLLLKLKAFVEQLPLHTFIASLKAIIIIIHRQYASQGTARKLNGHTQKIFFSLARDALMLAGLIVWLMCTLHASARPY